MLEAHETGPSLLHGDLWTGNAGVTSDGEPVIFVSALPVECVEKNAQCFGIKTHTPGTGSSSS
jgi:hypothetical protein